MNQSRSRCTKSPVPCSPSSLIRHPLGLLRHSLPWNKLADSTSEPLTKAAIWLCTNTFVLMLNSDSEVVLIPKQDAFLLPSSNLPALKRLISIEIENVTSLLFSKLLFFKLVSSSSYERRRLELDWVAKQFGAKHLFFKSYIRFTFILFVL